MEIHIRPAKPNEAEALTRISFASKRHWKDPEEYFRVWKDELTITPRYILENRVFAAEADGKLAGYFSIVEVKKAFHAGKVPVRKGFWMEHLFLTPQYIGKGIGSRLMRFAEAYCRQNGIAKLYIFSDPHAKGFYEKMGAAYLGESPSSIEGRTVPLFSYAVADGTGRRAV